ncbi:uracil phosphoribosyltransferase [Histoplasma capsulatum G186AR]|uniref:uracil phosphoribosyltransferase n=1 Tax=Ajellomyces capsulatus (strain G186AR / H82 / ATCC MYA-2454 / RMSCC 2432) TaxID=447093 RepID=C0NWK2_AJECG|nr:uracil phosphoribosyltransferase [Histoplasma capsulatum G186AR]EEH04307.1 uracil phosphoribosyltransferase [Histoplasma capsulatum G186AR]
MASAFSNNIHVSQHPCLRAKLSQLRSNATSCKDTNRLINDIAMIIGCEALGASLQVTPSGMGTTPLGYEYSEETIITENIALVPILRSGLGMVQGLSPIVQLRQPFRAFSPVVCLPIQSPNFPHHPAIQDLLPSPVAVHHLGLFREPTTLHPVEYYNNLPFKPLAENPQKNAAAVSLAIIVDPIIATGATCAAAIQTLKEWGVSKILVLSVLASECGAKRAAEEWPEGVDVWLGGVDPGLDAKGMIKPGVGDVGDRLFLALGK